MSRVPSMRPPPFPVEAGNATVKPVNALPTTEADHYVVIGAGKTAIDAMLHLLGRGVDQRHVTWIVPQDMWIMLRDKFFEGGTALPTYSALINALLCHDSVLGAFKELEAVVNEYSPGQGGIDGGGFAIQKSDPAKGYLYAQFEALKNGYVDDLEFAVVSGMGDRAVQLRSSSRVGYLDYGVNAKRVNYIAKALKAKGWNAPGVDFKTHPDYASQNNVA